MIDEKKKERFVRFISLLIDPKGGTKKNPKYIKWMPWQLELMSDIMCSVDDDGLRLVREAYIEICRKNGKTTMLAAICLYQLFCEPDMGQEIYSIANSRDQASILFQMMAAMIRANPALLKRCRIMESKKQITRPDTESFYRALSADASTAHGLNPNFVVADEIHEMKSRELFDTMKSGMGSRAVATLVSITTAGEKPVEGNLCWDTHQYAKKIIDGSVVNPRFYAAIFAADMDDDIYDESVWKKANPALGYHRNIEEFREYARLAKEIPSVERSFRRLYLGQWLSSDEVWVSYQSWLASAGTVDLERLKGRKCYAGLDLSSTTDITALVLVFPEQGEEKFAVLPFFWIPQAKLVDRKDGVDYFSWSEQGFVNVCEGEVIDYNYVIGKLEELSKEYNIREVAYDRWGAAKLRVDLEDRGFTMIDFGQGYQSMSPPMKELVRLVLEQKLAHGNNPVLNWMANNLIVESDAAGNMKPSKAKSTNKIDGMVALIMGLDRAIKWAQNASIYERRAPRSITV